MDDFSAYFGEVDDPRAGNARHNLLELIFVALAAVLCGAEDCTDMAEFARAKLGLLRQVVDLEHGPPSHDTFSRVFRLLDPEPFEAAFARFTAAFAGALEGVVAIDGKALRGAYERGRKATPLHLVNVWAAEKRLVIGQRLAPGRNEVAGVLEVLTLLRLDGCIVTADALHCRPDTAQAILATGADYALAIKENRPKLLASAKALIARGEQADVATIRSGPAHDRTEIRHAIVVPAEALDFPGIAAVGQVETCRRNAGRDEPPVKRWFLLSRPLTAKRLIEVARAHWTIENQLHWVLDVAFEEDAARSRKDHAPQNLALIRKLALNILRTHPDKGSIKGKIKRAGWNDAFLLSMLGHMR
ncbi:ISAs1 family transposase [Sphingobium sp. D43FB]|uniref:ISAs1 family transposase n=1 Tax=Sphingobium sp. D43FB TaxID=2017595 RepID=UPI000BB59C96|nr:ISAs1 family transposase [Sphingobium sp. D43FB]PBN45184.1 ISAs1 family transposase [Sphingobium sp. D43FB]|tara:strand:+ start:35 stop:1111 length:1077 start_codon:yes stop_codon:yes gene_type:complete